MGCRWQGRINRGWNPAYGSILLLPPALISFASYTSWFLHSPRPSLSAMATELPPSRFKMMASLSSLRRLMGWQAPGLAPKLKHGAASLANMRPRDFIFFVAYALARLVPQLSSFFLTPLEYCGLQLQHLSPNSIALVAIFVHLCEMFMRVQLSVRLFRRFFILKAVSQRPPLIGGYYFQCRTHGHAHYIAPISPGRWEHWREDWVLVQADAHDWLALPAGALTLDRTVWMKDPSLESSFDPVLDRIQHLAENGLTSLMVLHDFLSRSLTPLQDQPACPAWMYTGVNDIMQMECSPENSLDEALLAACLNTLTADQFSDHLMVSVTVCEPTCANQVARRALLAIMPTLDYVDITLVQRVDQFRGMVIPGAGGLAGAAGGHGQGGSPAGGCGGIPASCGLGGGHDGVSAVPPLLRSLAKANRHVSSLMSMRYCLTRTRLYRSGCDCFSAP
jgi:hypothetical protein